MTAAVCPCCGSPMQGKISPASIIATVRLTPIERRICDFLASRFGAWVSRSELTDYVYRDHSDGGPEYASTIVSIGIGNVHRKLAGTALAIEGVTKGSRGRRLTWVPAHEAAA